MEGQLFAHEVLAVVLRVRDRRLDCLLWQRAKAPFDGQWSLPRGPLGATERLGTSASRHLAAKVDITSIAHMEQLETRSDPDRDPRERVLATAYLALVATDVSPRIPADTAWHPVGALPETAFDHGSIIGSARERLRDWYRGAGTAAPPTRAGGPAGGPDRRAEGGRLELTSTHTTIDEEARPVPERARITTELAPAPAATRADPAAVRETLTRALQENG